VTAAQPHTAHLRAAFTVDRLPPLGVVKSNAYPLTCPSDVLAFTANLPTEGGAWEWVRAQTKGTPVIAAPFKGKVIALGTEDGVRDAFGDNVKGSIDRSPVDKTELSIEDGVVVKLFRKCLLRIVGNRPGLCTDERDFIWESQASDTHRYAGKSFLMQQAASLAIRNIDGRIYLVIKPTLRVIDQSGEEASKEDAKVIKNARLAISIMINTMRQSNYGKYIS
jgi:hypothetical protein